MFFNAVYLPVECQTERELKGSQPDEDSASIFDCRHLLMTDLIAAEAEKTVTAFYFHCLTASLHQRDLDIRNNTTQRTSLVSSACGSENLMITLVLMISLMAESNSRELL